MLCAVTAKLQPMEGSVHAPSSERTANGKDAAEGQRQETLLPNIYLLQVTYGFSSLLYILTPSTAATRYPSRKIFTKNSILQSSLATNWRSSQNPRDLGVLLESWV